MNFLLISKNSGMHFHCGDPFEYIQKSGGVPVVDYFEDFWDEYEFNPIEISTPIRNIFTLNGNKYSIIIYNDSGDCVSSDMDKNINSIATSIIRASMSICGIVDECIYSDAIIIKISDSGEELEMDEKDKKTLIRWVKDAIRWF